jgi:hypothetical protein
MQNELILDVKLERKKEILLVLVHTWKMMLVNKSNWFTAII